MKKQSIAMVLVVLTWSLAAAKDPPAQVVTWPSAGPTVLRFVFGKLRELGSAGGQRDYSSDVTVQNVWTKTIQRGEFSVYLFDKNKIRIGEGWIQVSNVAAGETVKLQLSVTTSGTPVEVSVVARSLPSELAAYAPSRDVSITVNSVPQGALLKVDGNEVGTTPKLLHLGTGKHLLEFRKEGYSTGHFPLEIGPTDASGGSVSFELGTASHDTVELRDGTVVSGDLEKVTATEVRIRSAAPFKPWSGIESSGLS